MEAKTSDHSAEHARTDACLCEHATRARFLGALAGLGVSAHTAFGRAGAQDALQLVDLTPTIAYVPGDVERSLTCNTGVIRTGGRLSLVDAAIPEGAAAAFRAIRARSDLPFERVVDTHFHLDHTYGNAFWQEHGAQPVAYDGVRSELASSEPEMFGGVSGLWNRMSATLPQLNASHPLAPEFVKNGSTFGSGAGAFVITHFGVAHTHSDAVVWVPEQRVLFTGDLVANGPYNAVADSTIDAWMRVLDQLRALRPRIVVPGHGPAGGPELIDAQQHYFQAVTREIDRAVAAGIDVALEVPSMRARLLADPRTMKFVNDGHFPYSGFFLFHDLAAKIYHERTNKTIARLPGQPHPARCCGDLRRRRPT